MLKWQPLTICWANCGAKNGGKNNSAFYKLLHKQELNTKEKKIIKKMKRKFSQISLIVIKASLTKKLGLSRPCNMCLYAMRVLGIKYVYYSTVDGRIIKEKVMCMEFNHESSYHQHSMKYMKF